MKSFRLDSESVRDVVDGWPTLVAGTAIFVLLAYFGWRDAVWRSAFVVFGAIYIGYVLRNGLTNILRSKYPDAEKIWLLSIGFSAIAFGIGTRIVYPSIVGGMTDKVWLAISFSTILAFVVLNRHNPEVLK